MTPHKQLALGISTALISVWVCAFLLTALPDHWIALEVATCLTMLIGLIGGVWTAIDARARMEQRQRY